MYTMSTMPSTTSVISAYTAFAASAMLFRSILSEFQSMATQLIPHSIREKIVSKFLFLFRQPSSEMTLIIDEQIRRHTQNEVFEAAQLYLQDKISPWNNTLKVTKHGYDTDMSIEVGKGEEIIDSYRGIRMRWVMICTESDKEERRSFELSFLKEHKDVVLASYLPHILELVKIRREQNRVVMLESLGGDQCGPVHLNHPSTFDTLAMDPALKKSITDDLDRFLKRREFYKRVGKAWKRGYLLYGPPGTGKSSLIAAMANYLKFNVYDVELTSIRDNMGLRELLISTENRSIVVIEDIDCSIELSNRETGGDNGARSGLTLSGLLNFIDGLWSSCSDERIIVFTTNYKDKLDPALLRPGRMDMHIHMSYLTPSGFRVLAFNYLGLNSHKLFIEIESLIQELEITPATIAEELMRGNDDDADTTLELMLDFLKNKKSELSKTNDVQGGKGAEEEFQETMQYEPKAKGSKSKVSRRSRKRLFKWIAA